MRSVKHPVTPDHYERQQDILRYFPHLEFGTLDQLCPWGERLNARSQQAVIRRLLCHEFNQVQQHWEAQ